MQGGRRANIPLRIFLTAVTVAAIAGAFGHASSAIGGAVGVFVILWALRWRWNRLR
jgi:hypothetical protein